VDDCIRIAVWFAITLELVLTIAYVELSMNNLFTGHKKTYIAFTVSLIQYVAIKNTVHCNTARQGNGYKLAFRQYLPADSPKFDRKAAITMEFKPTT
jgi:hypothetical protein